MCVIIFDACINKEKGILVETIGANYGYWV